MTAFLRKSSLVILGHAIQLHGKWNIIVKNFALEDTEHWPLAEDVHSHTERLVEGRNRGQLLCHSTALSSCGANFPVGTNCLNCFSRSTTGLEGRAITYTSA